VLKTVQPRRRVLFIGAEYDEHASLRQILDPAGWEFEAAFTARGGMDALWRSDPAIPVVICNHTLLDGDWKRILTAVEKAPVPPTFLVSSRLADERLWAEVLNLGAFDLLLGGPFDREEVLRVLENAWWASEENAKYGSPRKRRPPEGAQSTSSKKLSAGGGL
jgi:DNA-binding NtrC family response regulator